MSPKYPKMVGNVLRPKASKIQLSIALKLFRRSDGDVFVKIGFSSMGLIIINFGPNAGTEDDLTDHPNFFPMFRTSNHNFSRMGHFRFWKKPFFRSGLLCAEQHKSSSL